MYNANRELVMFGLFFGALFLVAAVGFVVNLLGKDGWKAKELPAGEDEYGEGGQP